MFAKRTDFAKVNIWSNGCVTINRGLGYARYFDKVYDSDRKRIESLLRHKKQVRKLTNIKAARLRFNWIPNKKTIQGILK